MNHKPTPQFIWILFQQLRRRHFPLGIDDYTALKTAMRAGFGWSSESSLKELCCSLWAKSYVEYQTIGALFEQLDTPNWTLPSSDIPALDMMNLEPLTSMEPEEPDLSTLDIKIVESPLKDSSSPNEGLPPLYLDKSDIPQKRFIFLPHFPLSRQEIGQIWRRYRQIIYDGPKTDLDINATIKRRCESGIGTPAILRPRQRNAARLLILIDSKGSMEPFRPYIEFIRTLIVNSGGQSQVACYYFHDLPAEGTDETILEGGSNELFPVVDPLLHKILPIMDGLFYTEPNLEQPIGMKEILEKYGYRAAVVIFSDAGAARKNYDLLRILDTVAFVKTLRKYTHRYAWLNPLPAKEWKNSTAEQISRYAPMFPIDKSGLYEAVNVLSGKRFQLDKQL
jgi:uncharacterized protein